MLLVRLVAQEGLPRATRQAGALAAVRLHRPLQSSAVPAVDRVEVIAAGVSKLSTAPLPLAATPPARTAMGRKAGQKAAAAAAVASSMPVTPLQPALQAAAALSPQAPRKRRRAIQPTDNVELAAPLAADHLDSAADEDAAPAGRRTRSSRKKGAAAAAAAGEGETLADASTQAEGETEEAPKRGRRREPDVPPLKDVPTAELLARLRAEGYRPPPLPVPNLGYACLNMELRELKPPVFTSRDCIKKTKDAKGLPHLGSLFLQNARDLLTIVQWNQEHGVRLFRLSSVLAPWMGTFSFRDLPQYGEIAETLRLAGDLARLYDQHITFHPSHFVKLAAPDAALAAKSRRELEAHSQARHAGGWAGRAGILDMMGYPPSPHNKINMHVGGVYSTLGSKEDTMRRFAANFALLSPACRARLTVENDDVASAFSLQDLLFLHSLTGVPLVFDFHHHKFNTGGLSEREALEAAVATWPADVRPVVHWSESQAGRKPHAHSDYVFGPIAGALHGRDADVDVMIEAKMKERALLAVRGDAPFPPDANGGAVSGDDSE